MIRRFAEVLGPLEQAALPEVRAEAARLAPVLTGDEWFRRGGRRTQAESEVRISGDVQVTQRVHKAPGGLVRAVVETKDDRIVRVSLSGDFFCYPADALRRARGRARGHSPRAARGARRLFAGGRVVVPGVGIPDWLAVLGAA